MKTTSAEVAPLAFKGNRSDTPVHMFGVLIRILPGSDEMWDTFHHSAVFRTEEEAQRLADRINLRRRGYDTPGCAGLNLRHWVFPSHPCSPFGPTEAAFFSPVKFD